MSRGPLFLVTAAAGKTGGAAARELLGAGRRVRAMVRAHDARSERLRALGAEVVVGSFEDAADLERALAGVQRAYFCPPLAPGALRRAALFAACARAAHIEAIALLSQWLTDPLHHSLHAREKWLAARVMADGSGAALIIINPGWFADNYFAALEPAAQLGVLALPLGQGLNAPPSNEDIGRVVAGVLQDPERHAGRSYRPTGPRLLSPDEIACAMGRALGRPVRYRDAPMGLFLRVARSMRLGDYALTQLHWFLLDYQRNSFGTGAPTDAVREVVGREPEDFDAIARRYVASSRASRRSLGGRLRAAAGIVRALCTGRQDVEAIERRLELPAVAHARLAADSPEWRALAAGTARLPGIE